MTIPNILTIAGSDCSGGAGIQADIKAISANGGYAMSVITALTAQNTVGVQAVEMMPTELVEAQLDSIFSDIQVDAVKIGMLGTVEMITCIAKALDKHQPAKVVLDPVMVAKGGDRLLHEGAVAALRDILIPKVDLITPNLPEASDLLGVVEAATREEMIEQASRLNVTNIFLKGGHLSQADSPDLLITDGEQTWFEAKRIQTQNTHGTGCTLSATIATIWGKGEPLDKACANAKAYLSQAIAQADELNVGRGHGPVNHFWSCNKVIT